MKKFLLKIVLAVGLATVAFGYEKGLFDLNYNGDVKSDFRVMEIPSDNKPGPSSYTYYLDMLKETDSIKSYFKMTLPQKGIDAAFKVIRDEGYSTVAYKVYMLVFISYSFSKNGVMIFMKFDKDGSAWFDCYEFFGE